MKSFQPSFFPSSVGTPQSNPPVRNPIVLPTTSSDASVTLPAGWYIMIVQGNDTYVQMNAATNSSTSPCLPKGYFDIEPKFYGIKAQPGGATAAPLVLHAATVTGSGIVSMIPCDPVGGP
jgi:hypothetical protein